MSMSWKEIMKYAKIISYIARKYAGDPDLAEDVSQEVMVKLFEDKRLNTKKFDPAKKDAAIRQTIRNKVLKVLRSRNTGRWSVDSLDVLKESGFQIDTNGNIMRDPYYKKHPFDEEETAWRSKIDGG